MGDGMTDKTATINFGGEPKAQVQLIDRENGERAVNLYNKNGIPICSTPFHGDDDKGYAIGQALFEGYIAGWTNCQIAIGKGVTKALYDIQDNMKI